MNLTLISTIYSLTTLMPSTPYKGMNTNNPVFEQNTSQINKFNSAHPWKHYCESKSEQHLYDRL
jgi:hypothetical protein